MANETRKRSLTEDSDDSRNESKFSKIQNNYWLYVESSSLNIAQYAIKNPKTFQKLIRDQFEGNSLDLSKLKFFLTKGILRVSCNNELQQEKLSKLNKLGELQVTVSLPWKDSKNSDKIDDQSKVGRQLKLHKYVISGVSREISVDEIKSALNCADATRISKLVENILTETETVILSFQSQKQLPCIVSIGYLKFKLKQYIPAPMRCKNCLGYGHTSKNCSRASRCLHCGNIGHLYEACNNKTDTNIRCANCGGQHKANDKICPKFTQACDAIRKTVANKGLTYSQALVGNTNTAATEGATVETPTTSNFHSIMQQQMKNIKREINAQFEQFSNQMSKDIQSVLTEYGTEKK